MIELVQHPLGLRNSKGETVEVVHDRDGMRWAPKSWVRANRVTRVPGLGDAKGKSQVASSLSWGFGDSDMPSLTVSPGVDLHYYDDDFTDPWRSSPTMLLQHGFSPKRQVLVQLGAPAVPSVPNPATRYAGNGRVNHRRKRVRSFAGNLCRGRCEHPGPP